MDENIKHHLKIELYEQFARIGKALGSPRRLEILDLLAQAEHSVEALGEKTGMSIANVSQHLQILRAARLVGVRREGTYAFYSLADSHVLHAWNALSALAQASLLEIDDLMKTYFAERAALEAITPDELLNLLQTNKVTVVDARPPDEYRAGHIPGAISMPIQRLNNGTPPLPKDRDYVAYCRTSYCLLSDELALALLDQGYHVRVLDRGMSDWRAAGLPVETGEGD